MEGNSTVANHVHVPPDATGLQELIVERARERAVFVEWEASTLSYAALLEDIRAFCGLFGRRGLVPGARIMIITGNERRAIGAFVAALLDGLVPVTLAPDTPAPRAAAIAGLVSPTLVLLDEARCTGEPWTRTHPVLAVSAGQPKTGVLGWLKPAEQLSDALEDALTAGPRSDPRCSAGLDDLAYILFTSGTTSEPKGVMVTHRNLFVHLETLARVFGYTPESGLFNGMVLAHADGLVQGPLLALACGCRLIRPPAFSAHTLERHLDMIRARRATHLLSVPSIYGFIDRYSAHDDYFAAPEFVALISVAAKLETGLWQRLERRFGRPIYNMYGLTETVASALYAGPAPGMGGVGTIGQPIDVAARIMRPDGSEADIGEAGEIWLKGENVSPGYYRAPEATAERFVDGWLKTGDLAVRRQDRAFEITGRIKTAIMCGGFLIQPEEIDEALLRHPAVAEAVTVGVPDAEFGEVAVSAVVLDGDLDEAELTTHCWLYLEPRKVPKRIVPVTQIPRGDAGKPRVSAVRAMLAQVLDAPSDRGSHNIETAVLGVAARTFRLPVEALSLDSTPETVERWDSFAHVSLIAAVETSLDIRLPTRDVIAVNSLGALAIVAARQKGRR